jgi:formamidopyrimidine-DNA glycosylase
MPELPDVEVFSRNLDKIFAGKKLLKVKIYGGKNITDSPAAFTKRLKGKKLKSIYRSGKEMRLLFSDDTLVGLHLMLTGDIFVFDKKNDHHSTLAELYFKGGQGLALTDRMKNAFIKLDPVDKEGIDAISPKLNFKTIKAILDRKARSKRCLLTNI